MSETPSAEERDRRVLDLYERLIEIEQRLIPTGLHVFGRAPDDVESRDLLRMVASFDRPELGVRSLNELVAEGLGLREYSTLINQSTTSESILAQRPQIESIAREVIERCVNEADGAGAAMAAQLLAERASVPVDESAKVFALLARILAQLKTNHELEGLIRALRGDYVEP